MSPPRIIEAMLDGLIDDRRVADDLLGDLAEEWSEHAADRGGAYAHLCYAARAVRAMPALIMEWWLTTRITSLAGLLVLGPAVRVATLATGWIIGMLIVPPLAPFGVPHWATTALYLTMCSAAVFIGGVIVIWPIRRPPTIPILWFTCVVATLQGLVEPGSPLRLALTDNYATLQWCLSVAAGVCGGS